MAGRPIKVTDAQIIASILRCKGLIYLAAKDLRVDPSTIHRRLQKKPKLRKVVEKERGEFVDTAELALLNAVMRGDAWAVCFALKTQGRVRGYCERHEIAELSRELEAIRNELAKNGQGSAGNQAQNQGRELPESP